MGHASSRHAAGTDSRNEDVIGSEDDIIDDGNTWVTLRTQTTNKQTRETKKHRFVFRPSAEGTTIGSAADADLVVSDPNMISVHARFRRNEDGSVSLETLGRSYVLIGQGSQSSGFHQLRKDQVVKMGACSLLVSDSRTVALDNRQWEQPAREEHEEAPYCYICFDSSSGTGNELMCSPCACRKPVHRRCLARWISAKGSRLCSVCKSKLPIDATVDGPYIVLQVVRHMRGLHWHGEREYIISFMRRQSNSVTIGTGSECDVALPDPSLSRCHSRIFFTGEKFHVEDLMSSAGTFLKVMTPLVLGKQPARLKLGRTMVTVQVHGPGSMVGQELLDAGAVAAPPVTAAGSVEAAPAEGRGSPGAAAGGGGGPGAGAAAQDGD